MSDPRKVKAYCPDCDSETDHAGWEIVQGPDAGRHGYFCEECDEEDPREAAMNPEGLEPDFTILESNPD